MSFLSWSAAPEGIVIFTDTLATLDDGTPCLYVTKCYPVPHLNTAIAGTGIGDLTGAWVPMVFNQLVCVDSEMLAVHTPAALRRIWSGLGVPTGRTSTVYHFGLSIERGEYVTYAFRSRNDFEPELIEPGFAVKPEWQGGIPDDFEQPANVEGFIALAEEIKAEQEALPATERINIGGELVLTRVAEGSISTTKVHAFADFGENWLQMNEVLHGEERSPTDATN